MAFSSLSRNLRSSVDSTISSGGTAWNSVVEPVRQMMQVEKEIDAGHIWRAVELLVDEGHGYSRRDMP
jgi:soluble P-type ATPase